MNQDDDHHYRRGVGIMLLNREGKVFVGARIDNDADQWQMPQGGIDEGEEPWAAALRELEEETGIAPHLVEKIAVCPERLRYSLPPELVGVIWKEKWVGQEQDWFLCRFTGNDSDVNLATGTITSKPRAVHWATQNLPEPWPALIHSSRSWQLDDTSDPALIEPVRAFVLWAAASACERG